jgi:hypothetical protein
MLKQHDLTIGKYCELYGYHRRMTFRVGAAGLSGVGGRMALLQRAQIYLAKACCKTRFSDVDPDRRCKFG